MTLIERLYTGVEGDPASIRDWEVTRRASPEHALTELVAMAEGTAGSRLLDRLPFGLVAIDAHRRVQFENATGQRMLDSGDPIVREGGRIRPWADEDSVMFAGFAEAACLTAEWPQDGRDMVISCRGSRTRIRLIGFRVGDPPDASLVLLLADAGREHALRRLLMTMFALTAAESHVVRLMMQGASLQDIAKRRGVTVSAVRGQWQTARSKIGNGGDAEILQTLRVALLLPLQVQLGAPDRE